MILENSFLTFCSETGNERLLLEWDYWKNQITPADIVFSENIKNAKQTYYWKCFTCGKEWKSSAYERVRSGRGCRSCSARAAMERRMKEKYGLMSDCTAEYMQEWNYEKNPELPENTVRQATMKVWWKCKKCGYEWQTALVNREKGHGCSRCGNRVKSIKMHDKALRNNGNIRDNNPELILEWDFEKNIGIEPNECTSASKQKVWWKCKECGNSWQAFISSRTRGNGCPEGGKKKMISERIKNHLKYNNSLAEDNAELIKEWDYDKNGDITPYMITPKSSQHYWWICEKGHSYEASLLSRYSDSGCPICSNKQVLAGYNDLATIKPDMLEKWNYEKNVIMPKEITYGSKRKVWWKCPECSYQWKAAVYTITGKRMGGCPRCAREARTSFPEQAAYFYIKQLFPSAINGDRVQIYPKELDIYIPEINVAIEYDGEAFHQSRKRDIEKNMLCQERGIFLYRIREMKCPPLDNVDNCVSYNYDRYDISSLAEVIKRICNRLGKDIDIDLERDELSIEEQYRKKKKENNLAGLYPELVKEWDYVKNKGLSPDKYSFGSSQKVWWICSKGHSYSCAINLRSVGNAGCPYCANKKVLQGYNDLLSRYPEISDEWCYEKNKERPENVVSGSHKKVWWKCKKCSGSWEATIVNKN